jgi:hypothetical protein
MDNGIPNLVDKILNQVRLFRDNSVSKQAFLKDLLNNPNAVKQEDIQENVKESSAILKELFDLINELDTTTGKNARPRD